MRALFTASLCGCCLAAGPALADSAKLLQKFSDWSAYVSEGSASKVCFAASEPKDQKPKGAKRDAAYVYVSSWPGEGVKNEVSFKFGYPFKPGGAATVTAGGQKFTLFSKDESAFVEKPDVEAKLIEAMGGGGKMTVQGKSQRGTVTTDEYSLEGAKQALDRASQECG